MFTTIDTLRRRLLISSSSEMCILVFSFFEKDFFISSSIYLFNYFGCARLPCRLPLGAASGAALPCGARLLIAVLTSVVQHRLQGMGVSAAAHKLSSSSACGVLPDQGSVSLVLVLAGRFISCWATKGVPPLRF